MRINGFGVAPVFRNDSKLSVPPMYSVQEVVEFMLSVALNRKSTVWLDSLESLAGDMGVTAGGVWSVVK